LNEVTFPATASPPACGPTNIADALEAGELQGPVQVVLKAIFPITGLGGKVQTPDEHEMKLTEARESSE
jgi:hypothetical protein